MNLSVMSARSTLNREEKADHYNQAICSFESLREILSRLLTYCEANKDALSSKVFSALPFAFEAILFTGDNTSTTLNRLLDLVQFASLHDAPKLVFNIFADCVLASDKHLQDPSTPQLEPTAVAKLVCELIVVIRDRSGYRVAEVSRWVRCIVEILVREIKAASYPWTNSNRAHPLEASLSILRAILNQANDLARLSYASIATSLTEGLAEQGCVYPTEEVEFLASTLFNLAIDLYVSGMDHVAKEWAQIAVDVAGILEMETVGRGNLARKLRTKIATLGWT
ncbi:MAG: hypothetical protein Q9160_006771 [Pyrenula sp. 1 TL-2023]